MAVKLSPAGRVLQVFGRRPESTHSRYPRCTGPNCPPHSLRPPYYETPDALPPPARDGLFDEVTDVAFDPEGNVYFSDGYNNARVAKYDADGNWVGSWGERGSDPGQFRVPHGIAADDQGRIYVSDSESDDFQNPGFEMGIRVGERETGWVTTFILYPWGDPRDPGGGTGAEFVAVDGEGNIYGGEPRPRRIQKYVRVRP